MSEINRENSVKYEYLMLDDLDEAALDERGASGWELVNFVSYTVGFGLGGHERMNVHMRFVFKRPIINLPPDVQQEFNRLAELRMLKAQLAAEIEARGDIAR